MNKKLQTDSAFQWYNLVTEEEMKGMQWLDKQEGKIGMMDTYMYTISYTLVYQIMQVTDIVGSREQNWTGDLGFMKPLRYNNISNLA